jgi:hypothetical protein
VAAVAGTLASLPFVLSNSGAGAEAVLSLAGVALSCLLFGVTYRYAVRQDLGNTQLKARLRGARVHHPFVLLQGSYYYLDDQQPREQSMCILAGCGAAVGGPPRGGGFRDAVHGRCLGQGLVLRAPHRLRGREGRSGI